MSALPKRYFSPEEYLTLESKAEYRSQYVGGEIFAMSGAQPWHAEITSNLVIALGMRFRGRPCKVYSTDLRVQVEAGDLFTYPDVVALCGEAKFNRASSPYSLLNPQVIIEVLSPTTEAFDRGNKFARYRNLASLTDYILVSSERMMVEHFTRNGNDFWSFKAHQDAAAELVLESVKCEIPLKEIYEQVVFPNLGAEE